MPVAPHFPSVNALRIKVSESELTNANKMNEKPQPTELQLHFVSKCCTKAPCSMHYGPLPSAGYLLRGQFFQLHKKVMARKITTDCGDHKQAMLQPVCAHLAISIAIAMGVISE